MIKTNLISKKLKYGTALFVVSGLLGGATAITLQAREESICKTESEKIFKEIISEWEDASHRANSTSRIALAPVIGEMQSIRRKTEKIEVPNCATFARFSTVEYMEAEINTFLKFMANEPNENYTSASFHKKIAVEEIAFIQLNGKSNYKFNSKQEMKHQHTDLLLNALSNIP
jgi:hypothetical protein